MEGIPLGEMNTSMTINATAAWLLALYIVAAEEQGVHPQEQLQGTTQNDIIKEFLARGTYAFPPAPSMRLIADTIAYTVEHVPKWNPINICSYHLQEAGATPVQEIAYAMSNAIAVLDAVQERIGTCPEGRVLRGYRMALLRDRRRPAHPRTLERIARSSAASRSSSTRACASSRSTRSCARWGSCGRSSAASATACRTRKLLRLPLRRAGQLAGPHRGAAGEQRAADRAGGAGGDDRPRRARAGDPAAGVERGAGPAAPVGPAVVAAHPAGARVRDRHPRVPGHLRGLEGDGGPRRGAASRARARRWRWSPSTAARSRRSPT